MSAATVSQTIDSRQGKKIAFLAASLTAVKLLAGVLWARTAAGYITHATDATGLKVVGIGAEETDNTDGASGALDCVVETGIFKLANSGSNAVTDAHIGLACFVEDNQTVASVAGTYSVVAGSVVKVDSDGVWVAVGAENVIEPGAAITALAALTSTNGVMAAAADDAAVKVEGEKIGDDVRAVHATLTDVITRLKAKGLLK
ncbi:hypothetical protein [Prosthecobacter sp.]|jgi:hypothetical protein|uniref:hypothetical protein n=1 Tax=Prosthecobacter sp. TaxID=1965333 RepID=UPI0037C77D8A